MNKISKGVGTQGDKIYIPRAVNAYVYDATDAKTQVDTLNAHIHLAQACLCQPFLIDSYFIKDGNVFKEHGIESDGFVCILTDKSEFMTSMTAAWGEIPEGIETPVWRPIYLPIKSKHVKSPELPESALVQVRNINSLANAFAKLHGLKNAGEIMSFVRSLNRNLY